MAKQSTRPPFRPQPGQVYRYSRVTGTHGSALGQVVVVNQVIYGSDPDNLADMVVLGQVLPTVGSEKRRATKRLSCSGRSLKQNYELAHGFEYITLGLDIAQLAPIAREFHVAIAYDSAFVYPVVVTPDAANLWERAIQAWAMPPKVQQVTQNVEPESQTPGDATLRDMFTSLVDGVVKLAERQDQMERVLAKLYDKLSQAPAATLDATPDPSLAQLAAGMGDIAIWLNQTTQRLERIEAHPTRMLDGQETITLAQNLALSLLELGDSFVEPLADRMAQGMVDTVTAKLVAHINRVMFTENFVKLLAQHLAEQKHVTGQQRIQVFDTEPQPQNRKGVRHG